MLLIPVAAAVVKVVVVVAAAVEDIVDVAAAADNFPAETAGVEGTVLVAACS